MAHHDSDLVHGVRGQRAGNVENFHLAPTHRRAFWALTVLTDFASTLSFIQISTGRPDRSVMADVCAVTVIVSLEGKVKRISIDPELLAVLHHALDTAENRC